MARIMRMPIGLAPVSIEPLNGPAVATSGSTESLSGFNQVTEGVGFLWRFGLSFPPMSHNMAREHRAWVMGQLGGSNATIWTVIDGDRQSLADLGVSSFDANDDQGFYYNIPDLAMTIAAAKGDNTVTLPSSQWAPNIGVGSWIGFHPFHLAAYLVTDILPDGRLQIYPPLRKAVAVGDFVTLRPRICLRLTNPQGANVPRSVAYVDGATFEGLEVLNEYVADVYNE